MSVVIGGGFASGQEVLQFFTGYGLVGIIGTLVSGVLLALLGMQLAHMSSEIRASSHKEVLYRLFGIRIGLAIDAILSFFLYGVGVVMLAGSGSIFYHQYGVPPVIGRGMMSALVVVTLCLNVKSIINMISLVMPFLLLIVLVITTYSIFNIDASIETLNLIARENNKTVTDSWLVSALLYASFNIAVGFPMLAVIGGMVKQPKTAAFGGVLGGLGLGILILLLNIGLFANITKLQYVEMPTLILARDISPLFSMMMSFVLVCMVYSTAVGMFFAFSARFAAPETRRFKLISAVIVPVGLGLSREGFSRLIGTVYPLLGCIGFILLLTIAYNWVRAQISHIK